jgi:hypothetical protein
LRIRDIGVDNPDVGRDVDRDIGRHVDGHLWAVDPTRAVQR